MSLTTPESVRKLQNALGTKAKNEPACRFHQLHDKVYRSDILLHAYELCRANDGAPGVDGLTFEQIESEGVEKWLASLREALHDKSYRPAAVRRVMILKPEGGGKRPLGIPTIRDRVAQCTAALVLQPIFEADFLPALHGYREGRGAHDAVEEIKQSLRSGQTEVIDADLSRYFDTIPHDQLMQSLARRIVDRHMLALLKLWLKVPVEERDDRGRPRMSGGKNSKQGVPQGSPLSPLLANIYINRLAKAFARRAAQFAAHLVNYADDFVILSRGRGQQIMAWLRSALGKMGLTLNESKTCLRDARAETFDFLGFTLGRQKSQRDGRWCYPSRPSDRSVRRFKKNIRGFLAPSNTAPWPTIVPILNSKIRGWAAYFRFGAFASTFRALDRFVAERVRIFFRRRHKVSSRGTRRFGRQQVYSTFGVVSLSMLGKAARS